VVLVLVGWSWCGRVCGLELELGLGSGLGCDRGLGRGLGLGLGRGFSRGLLYFLLPWSWSYLVFCRGAVLSSVQNQEPDKSIGNPQ
jgi:hypothetical protein